MKIQEYRKFIFGLINPSVLASGRDQTLVYLCGKLLNETGELLEVIDFEQDEKIIDELGDVSWYIFNMYNILDIDPQVVEIHNPNYIVEHQLIIDASKLSGLVLKKVYHGKEVSDTQITDLLHRTYTSFMNLLDVLSHDFDTEMNLDIVNNYNFEKLSKRHGSTYNADFYQKQANA